MARAVMSTVVARVKNSVNPSPASIDGSVKTFS
jgi:hypothetical protein